ncbi:MAG: Mannosylfructose-phosphate synthase [Actinomycetota bacterium]|jgi:glycosyltransferase involved in cell wall biosynthesis
MLEQKNIRVLYDEQIFLLQRQGGISVYFLEIIKQFKSHPELGVTPVLAGSKFRNSYLSINLGSDRSALSSTIGVLVEIFLTSIRNRRPARIADIVHHTFYLPGYLARFPGLPKVSTLFDMIPEYADSGIRLWSPHFRKKSYLKHSGAVVSISDSSTADMRRRYGFSFPVQTTYLGASSEFTPGLPRHSSLPIRYLLFVGNRGGYKNAKLAFEAFSEVAHSDKEVFLVLCGGGPLSHQEIRMLENLGIKDQIVQRDFPYHELPTVYATALALLYPTRYEGFGLPLVEAMASGIPVLASSTPINHEIAGSAASYFSLDSRAELTELIKEALAGSMSLKAKVEEGISRAKTFSWYRCAELTAKTYREVLLKEGGEPR